MLGHTWANLLFRFVRFYPSSNVVDMPHSQVALRAVPHRPEFYACISQGGSIEKLDTELAKWLVGLDAIVKHLSAFLEQGGYGKV